MPALKALGGRGESGRNPRVRPVPEPEMSRIAVDGTDEVLRGGCVTEGDDGAATVLSEGAEAVLLAVLVVEVVREDMLREARKGTRGKKSRGGRMGPAVKGGCSSMSVLDSRCCCSHTMFVQLSQNRSIPLRGESEI